MKREAVAPVKSPARWRSKPLIIAHIALSVSLIGLLLALVTFGMAGWQGADPRTVYPAMARIEAWLVTPLVLAALATGLAQALVTPGTLRETWARIKLGITAALALAVLFLLAPRLSAAADSTLPGAVVIDESARLRIAFVPLAVVLLLILNVALAIYKPGRRRT